MDRAAHHPAGPALCLAILLLAPGCGKIGSPRPPAPRGPTAPTEVAARQNGDRVSVAFRIGEPRGEKPSMQPVRVEMVRVEYPPGNDAPASPDAFRRRGRVVGTLDGDPLESATRKSIRDETLILGSEEVPQGTTLRYGIRVRDRRGRPSPLVVAPDLVPASPPAAPDSLEAVATAEGVRLRWSGPEGTVSPRYNLYRAPADGKIGWDPIHPSPLKVAEFLDTAVETGRTYRYEVRTAVSDSEPYLESVSGGPVTIRAEDRFPPVAPAGLVAVQEGAGIRLFWDPNHERDLSGYRVFRSRNGGEWELLRPDPVAQPLFLDRSVAIGDRITYRVTAVDLAEPPNESGPSDEVRIVVAVDPESPGAGDP